MNSKPHLFCRLLICLAIIAFPTGGFADEDAKSKASAEKQGESQQQKPDAKKTEPIKFAGVFESVKQSELSVKNEELTSLEIEKIIPHGTMVNEGQPIVWFAAEELDKKLHDAEVALELSQLALDDDEFAYEQFLKTQKLDREDANKKRDHAQKDYDYFVKTQFPREFAQAKQNLKSAEFSAESATEEYNQLSKMYEEDDLTEESEEIVLRRAKFSMESALFRLEGTRNSIKRSIDELIPRQEFSQEVSLERALMQHAKAMRDLDSARKKRSIEMEKKRREFAESEEKFQTMQKERRNIVLKAPHDGIFIHGKLARGKLGAKPIEHKPKTKVAADQVIGTIANPDRLQVHAELSEQHLATVKSGMNCVVTTKAAPKLRLNGKVKSVAKIGYVNGKYDCIITLRGKTDSLLPTMACEVEIKPVAKSTEKQLGNKQKQGEKA